MAGTSITFRLDTAPLRAALGRLDALAGDMSPVMASIASHLEERTLERFELEQAPGGSPWPPSIRAKLTGGQTLTDTARLRQSITSESDSRSARAGTNVEYAAIHQFGGTIKRQARTQTVYRTQKGVRAGDFRFVGRRKSDFAQDVAVKAHEIRMPARPFLGIDPTDETAIAGIVADAIAAGWAGGAA